MSPDLPLAALPYSYILILTTAAYFWMTRSGHSRGERAFRITPFTSYPGSETQPAFSPDGAKIAFVRGTDAAARNIDLIDAQGGEPQQLTSEGRLVLGLAWTPDSSKIIFSSNRGSAISLWQVSAKGGRPESVGTLGFAIQPAISPKGNRLAYSEGSANWSTIRIALKSPTTAEVVGTVLASTEQESAPKFSPDDRRIAFQSWRSGSQEIWQCAADGSGPVKMTSFEGPVTGSQAGHLMGMRSHSTRVPKAGRTFL